MPPMEAPQDMGGLQAQVVHEPQGVLDHEGME